MSTPTLCTLTANTSQQPGRNTLGWEVWCTPGACIDCNVFSQLARMASPAAAATAAAAAAAAATVAAILATAHAARLPPDGRWLLHHRERLLPRAPAPSS